MVITHNKDSLRYSGVERCQRRFKVSTPWVYTIPWCTPPSSGVCVYAGLCIFFENLNVSSVRNDPQDMKRRKTKRMVAGDRHDAHAKILKYYGPSEADRKTEKRHGIIIK